MEEQSLGKCCYCKAELMYDNGKTYTKCSACGRTLVITEFENKHFNKQTSEDTEQTNIEEQSKLDELVRQYHRAENLQMDMVFDKAEDEYGKVIVMGGKDPEVYWRIILCHYGVVYQRDNEGNLIPSILKPDLSSQLSAIKDLENSYRTEEDRKYYSTELEKITSLLDKYRQCKLTTTYDVFISVKQKTHFGGKETPTEDYIIASNLYHHLTNMGLHVFNSEQQDCKKPGDKWEPYILAALLSSKVMIVVGTSKEYMESQWVQNEWRRFQWLQKEEEKKAGRTERKLICFIDNMTGYDLPRDLEPLQAIINKAGAYQELDRTIKDCFPDIAPKPEPQLQTSTSIELTRQKMYNWLSFKQYDLVKEEYNRILQEGIYSLDVQINLYSICAEHKLDELSMLETAPFDLGQEEKIQVILKSNKNQHDLKMLHELLEKNQRNQKEEASHAGLSLDNNIETLAQMPEEKENSTEHTADNKQIADKFSSTLDILRRTLSTPSELKTNKLIPPKDESAQPDNGYKSATESMINTMKDSEIITGNPAAPVSISPAYNESKSINEKQQVKTNSILHSGSYIVGTDIPTGRYIVSLQNNIANSQLPHLSHIDINEYNESNNEWGKKEGIILYQTGEIASFSLIAGQKISISTKGVLTILQHIDINQQKYAPGDTLYSGSYLAGMDIPTGKYVIVIQKAYYYLPIEKNYAACAVLTYDASKKKWKDQQAKEFYSVGKKATLTVKEGQQLFIQNGEFVLIEYVPL